MAEKPTDRPIPEIYPIQVYMLQSVPAKERYKSKESGCRGVHWVKTLATQRGVDISTLKLMLWYIHALEHDRLQKQKRKLYLRSFMRLPGEIRNRIYDFALTARGKVYIGTVLGFSNLVDRSELQTLGCLSLVNRQISKEARSFFYANNDIRLSGKDWPRYRRLYRTYGITNIATRALALPESNKPLTRYLELHYTFESWSVFDYLKPFTELRRLTLSIELHLLIPDQRHRMALYFLGKCASQQTLFDDAASALTARLETFGKLEAFVVLYDHHSCRDNTTSSCKFYVPREVWRAIPGRIGTMVGAVTTAVQRRLKDEAGREIVVRFEKEE